ncbi:MAG: hypothetical protein M3313_14650 [Actinomycetota bacterium]|nr:hypothetical protein [Actinomycetota bacterium]
MRTFLRTTDAPTLRLLDGLVTFWVVLWVVLGLLTGYEVQRLTSVSDAAQASARAADTAGEALQSLDGIPFVGERSAELGDEVRAAAEQVRLNAEDTSVTLRRLGLLLGASIILIPLTPVFGMYVPNRLGRGRELRALRRRLRSQAMDRPLEAYLARRAVDWLPYDQLMTVSDDPAGDLRDGRHGALARAELSRLGLRPGISGP